MIGSELSAWKQFTQTMFEQLNQTRSEIEECNEAEKRKHYIRLFAAAALPAVIARHPNRGQYNEFTGDVAKIAIKQWEALEWRFKREEGGDV